MKNHKSHHIFLYLGLLVLLFVIIFGIRYFQGKYQFKDVATIDNTSSYNDGIDTVNPFSKSLQKDNVNDPTWQTFKKNNVMLSYPKKYQLSMDNQSKLYIRAPHTVSQKCEDITDEQERALCYTPHLSPNININIIDIGENPFLTETKTVTINGKKWQRSQFGDEYGGTVWFKGNISGQNIEVSYRYTDGEGGQSFTVLQQKLGDQYQLSQEKQERLVRDIIATIKVE